MPRSREGGPPLFDDQLWLATASRFGLEGRRAAPGVKHEWPPRPLDPVKFGRPVAMAALSVAEVLVGEVRGLGVVAEANFASGEASYSRAQAELSDPLLLGLHGTLVRPLLARRVDGIVPEHARAVVDAAVDDPTFALRFDAAAQRFGGLSCAFDDHRVGVMVVGVPESAEHHALPIELAVELAGRLDHARRRVPRPPEEAALARALETFASRQGLTFDPRRIATTGDVAGVALEARLEVFERAPVTVLRAGFALPLGLGLAVRRERRLDGLKKLLGLADVQTGDAPFDRTFLVQGDDEDAVRERLDEPVRKALLELGADPSRTIALGDDAIEVRSPGYLAMVDATLATMLTIASGLSRAHGANPYR